MLKNKQFVPIIEEEQIYAQADITTDSLSKLIYEDKLNAEKNAIKFIKYMKKGESELILKIFI